jgi:nicotinamidase-related amidase
MEMPRTGTYVSNFRKSGAFCAFNYVSLPPLELTSNLVCPCTSKKSEGFGWARHLPVGPGRYEIEKELAEITKIEVLVVEVNQGSPKLMVA